MSVGLILKMVRVQFFLAILLFHYSNQSQSQSAENINVSQFGFKPDGKTDNTEAFQRLVTYVNKKGGNVILSFPKGVYCAGKQTKTLLRHGYYLSASDVMGFVNVRNVIIKGVEGTVFKYNNNLYFGSFEIPSMTKINVNRDFYKPGNACYIGNFISFTNSSNISIEKLALDGNAEKAIVGGTYGDVGIQIPYTGIYIKNARNVSIKGVQSGNFGLDGCMIFNNLSAADGPSDSIIIEDSRFFLNGRQGLSWTSGKGLEVRNSIFELTGKGKNSSAPGAGLDIEAEEGTIRNGQFTNCTFYNNTGCALVSETGDVANCRFDSCSFIGITHWSVWVRQPQFTFADCTIWGSGVHGYSSASDAQATRFIRCRFTDEPYNGMATYGTYLFESNGVKRLSFENCLFEAKERKVLWLDGLKKVPTEEFYKIINCEFNVATPLKQNDYYTVLRQVSLLNNKWNLSQQILNNRNPAIGIDDAAENNQLINNSKGVLRRD
jgi:hypothetical protein